MECIGFTLEFLKAVSCGSVLLIRYQKYRILWYLVKYFNLKILHSTFHLYIASTGQTVFVSNDIFYQLTSEHRFVNVFKSDTLFPKKSFDCHMDVNILNHAVSIYMYNYSVQGSKQAFNSLF